MPFIAHYLAPDATLKKNLTEAEAQEAFSSRAGLLWMDISETDANDAKMLENVFHFHRLAIEDCVDPLVHPPKIDDFDDYLFIIIHGINHMIESEVVETTEIEIFLGPHFVISNHNFPMYAVDSVRRRVEEDGRPMRYGAQFLNHAIIDAVIDNVLPTMDKMSEVAETIEEKIIDSPDRGALDTIMALRKSVLRMHRVMAPQREVLNRLSRGEFPIISAEAEFFYRDLYDRIIRLEDLNQTLRERADTMLSAYFLSTQYRQNEIMKVFSLIAAVFLPLNLLAGLYGMNVPLPGQHEVSAFYIILALMGIFTIATVAWFNYRGWFDLKWFFWDREPPPLYRLFKVEPRLMRRNRRNTLPPPAPDKTEKPKKPNGD